MKHKFGSLDDDFAEYAVQSLGSDGDFYRKYVSPLIDRVAQKIVTGGYDPQKVILEYLKIIDNPLVLMRVKKDYNEYYDDGSRHVITISLATKSIIAKELMEEYEETLFDRVKDLTAKRSIYKAKPEDYIRREVKSRMKKEKPAYERVASFYDVTQVAKNGEQSFVAKTKTLDVARMIANKTADTAGVKEARIIKWYPRKDGTKGFKVKETYSKHRKEINERKVF
jgi:hypothetical protein